MPQPTPELRSLEHRRLRLLHRSNPRFFILGSTGNVYTVTLSATPSCTCPHPTTTTNPNSPCKHILFLYIHVLSLPPHDPCLRRRTLRPCHLARLLSAPVSSQTLAEKAIRNRFHEMYPIRIAPKPYIVTVEDGSTCPVCLEEMVGAGGRRLVACATCKNPIHGECLMAWKKMSRTCVICRARWRDIGLEDRYINLLEYVSQGDDVAHSCG